MVKIQNVEWITEAWTGHSVEGRNCRCVHVDRLNWLHLFCTAWVNPTVSSLTLQYYIKLTYCHNQTNPCSFEHYWSYKVCVHTKKDPRSLTQREGETENPTGRNKGLGLAAERVSDWGQTVREVRERAVFYAGPLEVGVHIRPCSFKCPSSGRWHTYSCTTTLH